MDVSSNPKSSPSHLIRGLGAWAAAAIVIGAMIGQSVFLVASDMSREVGTPAKVLVVWIVGGVIVLFGAFCFAELGAALPEAGGDYVYLNRGIGPLWGFLFGWTSSLIMRPGSAAGIATGLLRFTGFLYPSVSDPLLVWNMQLPFVSHHYQFTLITAQALAAVAVLLVTILNYFGVRTGGRIQIVLTTLKVFTVIAIIGLGLTARNPVAASQIAVSTSSGLVAFLTALVPAMLAYNGFQYLGLVGGEVMNPQKNLPRAAILGTSLVILLYVSVNWIFFRVLPISQIAQSQHVASDVVLALMGGTGAKWFTVAMMVSAFGALHSGFLTGPRVTYAMARDKNFFQFAARVQPTFHTPSGAVIFEGVVTILLVLTGTYQQIYSYTIFATWIFLALTAFALVRLRMKEPELSRPYRVWGYPFTPVAFGIVAFSISVNLWLVQPVRSSIGMVIILLGVPFFYYWRRQDPVVS